MRLLFLCVSTILFATLSSHVCAQYSIGVPFLNISASPDGNGWGGIGTAAIFENPMAAIANPAQLGLFAQRNHFAFSSYLAKASWNRPFPFYYSSHQEYNVFSVSGGMIFNEESVHPISLGVGYSQIYSKDDEYFRTNSLGIQTGEFKIIEKSDQLSLGFGVTYFARFSIGLSLKRVVSDLTELSHGGTATAEPWAFDFGFLSEVSLFEILKKCGDQPLTIFDNIHPLTNFALGYTRSNIGGKVVYVDAAQGDPLPRKATIGFSIELGATMKIRNSNWRIVAFHWAREAGDILVTSSPNGEFEYKPGITGDISFFRNVLFGKPSDAVELKKGWQLNFGEIVYLRGGSFSEPPNYGNRNYSTSGFGLHLSGFFALIDAISVSAFENNVLAFIRDHIDVQYDHAEYADHEILGGTKFNALSLVIR